MKTPILVCLAVGLFCQCVLSQTADDYVNQGLADLGAQNIVGANVSFAQALSLNPNHENANALYAVTRLLVLPYQPAGSNFLTHIGFPTAGRNIYAWSSMLPKDTNGMLLAPVGVNANEFTAQLRTNALLAVSGAINNLSLIKDTNFVLNLTSSETAMSAVTLDFGDLKMIQAGLYASEYFIYTLNAQNLDAQLTAIRALQTNGILSASQVLANYPQLFNFATTNDLQAARAAFTNAVGCYMTASAFIRTRPPGEVRLVNYDNVSAKEEGDFRLTLQDLENSLVFGPQILALDYDLAVDMTPQFSGSTTWRSLLPKFDGNAVELGSLPDVTFGGVIYGLTREDVESYLSDRFVMLPVGYAPLLSADGAELSFATLRGHNYTLEATTNLVNWQSVTNFTAAGALTALTDSQANIFRTRFYRLREDLPIVSNLKNAVWGYFGISTNFMIGQEFTLPSGGGHYVLNKVTLSLSPTNGGGNISVGIWNVGFTNNPSSQIDFVASQLITSQNQVDFIPSSSIVLPAGASYYVVVAPTTLADSGLVSWAYTSFTSWNGNGVLGGYADTIPGYWENFPITDGPQLISVEATPVYP